MPQTIGTDKLGYFRASILQEWAMLYGKTEVAEADPCSSEIK